MQLFWDWVRSNRAGYTGTSGLTLAGDVQGTGLVPGTLTSTLGTTGVAAGTYGGTNVIPSFIVDAKGRILSATNAGTAGTGGGGTGGGFNPWALAGDASGTATTGTLTMALATTGVTAGTYGTGGTTVAQVVVDAKGRLSSVSDVGITFPASTGTYAGAGDVLGTGTLNGTATYALSTTGVTAGTYGTGGTMVSQVTVDAKGRLTAISNVGIVYPAAIGTFTGAVVGTGTFPGGPVGFGFTPNPAFAGTGTAVGWRVSGTSTAAMLQAGTATGVFARWGTSSQTLVQGVSQSLTGTGTYGGVLSTRALQGALGSSGSQSNAVMSPYVNANAVSLTTVAGTLMAYGVPANALAGSGQGFRFNMWGTAQNFGVRFALQFGTATLAVATSTFNGAAIWRWSGEVLANSATTQEYWAYLIAGSGPPALGTVGEFQVGTLGMNLSTVTTLAIVGTGTLANTTRTQRGMVVDIFGRQ